MEDDVDTKKMRNICILAHVDHGKTTLADHLIASCGGGVLHPKLAGKLRYLDYLDEEQRRAITMKSSSIALRFKEHQINLIDSPGHIDFCSEVSTAARLSDGALVLVDAVEGVHIQTHAVLRQAWVEKLTPCLVINKIDRLISELKMTPMEAYTRLLRIVHEVNGIISAFKSEKYLSDVYSILADTSSEATDQNLEFIDDDEEVTFQPHKGNVAFVCALEGWGFTTKEFSEFYASKLGAKSETLQKALWGSKYFNPKTKMIMQKKNTDVGSKSQPMFVQFILEPLWQVYQSSVDPNGNKTSLQKVIDAFKLNVPSRELQNKDPKFVTQAVLSRWLPLSDAVLSMVIKCMPDPVVAQSFRLPRLLPKQQLLHNGADPKVIEEAEIARNAVEICNSSPEAPCIVFVSKMFALPLKMLPQRDSNGEEAGSKDSNECFLAFARIFSGVLHTKQKMYVLSPSYNPSRRDSMQKHMQEAEIHSLYLMMGQGLKPVNSAKAGNIVAIRGLGQQILKTATLSSVLNCWPFSTMEFQVSPTLRVAIEPSDPADMSALIKGLRLLNRADPLVEITVSSRGEHVLAVAGEVHLERCIKDLRERFARVSIEVSPPIVSYKETIEGDAATELDSLKSFGKNSDYVEKITPNGRCVVRVHVMKLPSKLIRVLDENANILGDIVRENQNQTRKSVENEESLDSLKSKIMDALECNDSSPSKWEGFLRNIWALGPNQIGPNILFTPFSEMKTEKGILIEGHPIVSQRLGWLLTGTEEKKFNEAENLENSIVSGFQLATAAGPLCDEPLWGLGFVVEAHLIPVNEEEVEPCGVLSGQVMTLVKDACRAAVLGKKPRLVEAMYFCELSTPTEYLGSLYAVLNRRRARVLKEEMLEGSPLFTVHAYVPVAESLGFADELRRWTSGASSALLVLSHWEELSEDPFFVPKTEEEIEEFGDGSSVLPNTARKLIDAVRRRKGLPVEEKVVAHATKQRTLARKV